MITAFQDHLAKFSTNPYLFIGSGLSRRFVSLPTWEELLVTFYNTSGINGEYEYHRSKANGNLPMLASQLAEEFHEVWWKSPNFKESRTRFKSIAGGKKDAPFKIQLSEIIREKSVESEKYSKEISLLKSSVIDGIVTTNWDLFLENSFDDYKTYIGQQELLFSEGISIGEIYKIHGCISNPQSLVVTDEDYRDFNDRNAYLAAKLLTIFVEHPILFLGYSLSDDNIQQIIDSIVRCVDTGNLNKLKDRLIFVEWHKNAEFEIKDSSMKLPDNKVLPIKLITTDSFEPVFQTLSTLKRRLPVKILRKLKSSVVEFVKTSRPTNQIYVKDIETINDNTNIEYAIGVGVASQFVGSQGYTMVDGFDLIDDVLNNESKYDPKKLLEQSFPLLMRGNAYLPVYKYLRELGYLTKTGTLNSDGVKKIEGFLKVRVNVPDCFLPKAYNNKQAEIRRNHKDVSSIVNAFDANHALIYVQFLEHKNIDLTTLRSFLVQCFANEELRKKTDFKKLVCLYDYLAYGLNALNSDVKPASKTAISVGVSSSIR